SVKSTPFREGISLQIHVVEPGQSLFSIANTYGTTINAVSEANELDAPNQLVVGQALVIPIIGQFYFVKPGDTLSSIGSTFNISAEELARINNIQLEAPLAVGMRLYIPDLPKEDITSLGYIEPFGTTVSPTLINTAEKTAPDLTFLAL